mgnify:CR=1 FL=1
MLGISPELCEPVDVTDVLGEVANTIGGNVKACLGEGLALTLPEVTPDATLAPGAVTVRSYRCEGFTLTVALYLLEARP